MKKILSTPLFIIIGSFVITHIHPLLASNPSLTEQAANIEKKLIPVVVAPIRQAPLEKRIHTVGTLTRNPQMLSFQIPGRLKELSVEEGEIVKKNAIVARLADEDANTACDEQALLLKEAQRKFIRARTLHQQAFISKEQFEEAQDALYKTKLAYNQALLNLQRCVLSAPHDGKILAKHMDSLTSIQSGTLIYTFQSFADPWIVKTQLTEKQSFSITDGTPVQIQFAPYPQHIFRGKITKIASWASAYDGLYEVKIEIEPPNETPLKAGMLADVVIVQKSKEQYSIVPLSAILRLRNLSGSLFVVDKKTDQARKLNITIHSFINEFVALNEQLNDFDYVITHGKQNVIDGSLIQVIEKDE
jgi:membrane fusion protein, multidrug efflux system